jgi:hypothetical protein
MAQFFRKKSFSRALNAQFFPIKDAAIALTVIQINLFLFIEYWF